MVATMRDGSVAYETAWLSDKLWERKAPDLSTGVGCDDCDSGLGAIEQKVNRIPKVGRQYIQEALRDPEARPLVLKLLASRSPEDALAQQAERDLAEGVQPTGKVIVFKSLVRRLAPRLKNVEKAVASVADARSEVGRVARAIAITSKNPKRDVQEYVTAVAMATLAPDAEWIEEEEGLGDLGRSWKKTIKSYSKKVKEFAKKPLVRKIAIGAAIVVGAAITGGVILPAIAPALGVAASAIAGVAKSIFAPGAAAPAAGSPTPTGADQSYIDRTVLEICELRKRGTMDIASDVAADEKATGLVAYLVKFGMGQAEAAAAIQSATAACVAGTAPVQAKAPAAAAPTASTPGLLEQILPAAVAIYAAKQTGDFQLAKAQQDAVLAELKATGMSDAEAQALLQMGMAQAQSQAQQYAPGGVPGVMPEVNPPPGTMSMSAGGGDLMKYGLIAALGYGLLQAFGGKKGGGRRRSRRRR